MVDGAGSKPSYSLRTLCRALEYARVALSVYGLQRALYDGFAMAFLTQLHDGSAPRVEALLRIHFLGGVKSIKVWPKSCRDLAGILRESVCCIHEFCSHKVVIDRTKLQKCWSVH